MVHDEDCDKAQWQESLSRVLNLIRTNSSGIVDDTSLEKLLTWISSVAVDGRRARSLIELDSGILNFLSPPHQTIFECSISANFALRLTGIIAGCSSDSCEILDKNGTLRAMFSSSLQHSTVWDNAAVRHAFFQGLSYLLDCDAGYKWILKGDFIIFATNSFNDKSFYVVQSAIRFLTKVLVVSGSSGNHSENLDNLISKLSDEFSNCKQNIVYHYYDVINQLLDTSPDIAVKLFKKLPSIYEIVEDVRSETSTSNIPLISSIIELSGKLVSLSRNYDFPWHQIITKKDPYFVDFKITMIDAFIKVAVGIAKSDTKFAVSFLVKLACNEGNPSCIPFYWNELMIRVLIESCLSKCDEKQEKSTIDWLSDTLKGSKEYPMPEEVYTLLDELQQIFTEYQSDLLVWKRNFILILDSKAIFSKEVYNSCTVEGNELVEQWALFLSNIMVIAAKKSDKANSNIHQNIVDVLANRTAISRKCCLTLKSIVSNGWFSDFSDRGKRRIVQSFMIILADSAVDTKTLSECLLAVSAIAELEDTEAVSSILGSTEVITGQSYPATSIFEGLLNCERWEVQDSLIEFLIVIIKGCQKKTQFLGFMTENKFWMKSFNLLDADESYIRASSVRLLCFVVKNETLREIFKEIIPLDALLAKLIEVLQSDDEAFPRRSTIELVLHWLEIPQIRLEISKGNITSEIINIDYKKTDEIKMIEMIISALGIAALDFDWEVKMKGIQCWHEILMILPRVNSRIIHKNKENAGFTALYRTLRDENSSGNSIESQGSMTSNTNCTELKSNSDSHNGTSRFNILCNNGGALILVNAINDCDQMVREAAISALVYAKRLLFEYTHRARSAHTVESAQPVGPAQMVEFTQRVESACSGESAHTSQSAHTVESARTVESAHTGESAYSSVDSGQTVYSTSHVAEPAPTAKSVHYAEAAHIMDSTRQETQSIFSCHDIEDKQKSFELDNVEGFSKFLQAVDFVALGQSLQLADAQVANYPMSLLNDILAASIASNDNLLDCY